jgi:hypothetical protein
VGCCVLVLQGKAKLVRHWGPSLYHIDDLPFGEGLANLPSVFTPFREKVEKQCKVRSRAQRHCAVCVHAQMVDARRHQVVDGAAQPSMPLLCSAALLLSCTAHLLCLPTRSHVTCAVMHASAAAQCVPCSSAHADVVWCSCVCQTFCLVRVNVMVILLGPCYFLAAGSG